MSKEILTQSSLKELLNYDSATGQFTRLKSTAHNAVAGTIAGSYHKHIGYIIVSIKKKPYLAHRLAWFYTYGTWPEKNIDHVNGVRTDNRIDNLRVACQSQNMMNRPAQANNTSGFKGVSWNKFAGKWHAACAVKGKHYHLGYFTEKEAASDAYTLFAKEHFGEFFRQNSAAT